MDNLIEVEFCCDICDRIHFELMPESEVTDELDTSFEHDFDCLNNEEMFDDDEE